MPIVAPETCPDCGAPVKPTAKPGRTRRAKGGDQMPIPDTLCIPTCTRCNAEWMDDATAKALSALDKSLSPYERFACYRRGWVIGASSRADDDRYLKHENPIIVEAYKRGREAGHQAMLIDLAKEAERLGYDPMMSVLRGKGADEDPPR